MFSDTRYEAESRRIVSDLDATMLGGGGFEADLAMEEWVPLGDKESTPSWISLPIQRKGQSSVPRAHFTSTSRRRTYLG